MHDSSLSIVNQSSDGELTTTSLIIAKGTEAQHASIIRLLRDNIEDFQEFGRVGFEIEPFETAGGTQERTIAVLNRDQAMLLMTYMRNSPIVREFKKNLVRAFSAMEKQLATPTAELTGPELMARAIIEADNTIRELEQAKAELAPKADAYDAFIDADGTYSIGNVAKMLGYSQNKLFALLRNHGILISKGAMRNTPYQKYMHHFAVNAYEYQRSDGQHASSYTTRVQPSGVDFIRTKLAKQEAA